MNPDRWKKVDRILQLALDHQSDDRDGFIAQACDGDADLVFGNRQRSAETWINRANQSTIP